ncbi:MAG: type II secretion system protein [Parachlamydiaceae bacterium]
MQIKNIKKRFLTLIEMMIVMFIIALITGGLAYRYVGSLDESRAFKTKVAMDRLSGILNLKAADDPSFIHNISSDWYDVASKSPLVSNPNDIANDGWGNRFTVDYVDGEIKISSQKYNDYLRANKHSMFSNSGSRQ